MSPKSPLILSGCGVFEPTPFADGTNVLISIGRGDWSGASMSGLSILPFPVVFPDF